MSTKRSERGPIWSHPEPGQRKPKFSREQIAEAALHIADTEGFEAVSMRRIAEDLGAGTMTLYHYVRTKDDLMALMNDAIMASVLIPDGELPAEWRPALHRIALGSYRAFMRHPWALDALRGAKFGPNSMRHVEQSMQAVAHAPFDRQGKMDALGVVDDYVFGHVLRLTEMLAQKDFTGTRPSKALVKFATEQIATGEFPHLQKFIGDGDQVEAWGRAVREMNDAGRFLRGLEVLLDGLEARAKRPKSR